MTDAIIIQCDNQKINQAFARLIEQLEGRGMEPAMNKIGQALKDSTKKRFLTSTGPDGYPWPLPKAGTMLARMHDKSFAKYYADNARNRKLNRVGKLTKAAAGFVATNKGHKPLFDSGTLARTITYQLIDNGKGVVIGTSRFSEEGKKEKDGKKSESKGKSHIAAALQFGTDRAGRDHNITIPARPFLGVSKEDEVMVLDILRRMFQDAVPGL